MTQPLRRWYDCGPEITLDEIKTMLKDEALMGMAQPPDAVAVHTVWFHDFPDTGGPHPGGGVGCAFTTFTVIGFAIRHDPASIKCARIKWCDGVWKEWDGVAKGW